MKSAHILLVEDNEGDIILTIEALEERKIINRVDVVKNGKEALDYLFQKGKYVNQQAPDLILLDVNLPKKNGHEVLEVIKSNKKTKKIPVIMLTTSSSKTDIDLSYEHHANCYITKPVEMSEFLSAIYTIEDFWFQLVKLPKGNA
ncbi:MAG: response regulator [Chitinophagaceae bacterium]|nr:MAG: response regulator [Chitinophagaceae bacterium]